MTVTSNSQSRYGKSLRNVTLRERYEEQLTSPDLLSLRDEQALIVARMGTLMAQLDGAGIDFLTLYEMQQAILTHAMINDTQSVIAATTALGQLLAQGIKEMDVWREAYAVIDLKRKLVDTEMKTISSIGGMLSMEQFMQLLAKLVAAIDLHVEKSTMSAIHGEIEKILDLTPTGREPV